MSAPSSLRPNWPLDRTSCQSELLVDRTDTWPVASSTANPENPPAGETWSSEYRNRAVCPASSSLPLSAAPISVPAGLFSYTLKVEAARAGGSFTSVTRTVAVNGVDNCPLSVTDSSNVYDVTADSKLSLLLSTTESWPVVLSTANTLAPSPPVTLKVNAFRDRPFASRASLSSTVEDSVSHAAPVPGKRTCSVCLPSQQFSPP